MKIVKVKELPQWIISSDKAAYHPYSKTIYLTAWKYLPHELIHYFADITKLKFIHKIIDIKNNFRF
jgi:hypothetical protein